MEWKIVAGRTKSTYQIVTTEDELNVQTADWGLSTWGAKVNVTYRDERSTWLYVHEGSKWTMDSILKKQD